MPAFDIVVVGAGGGPSELNTSGYLLKAHESDWSDGIVGLEAGSGLGALERALREKPDLFASGAGQELCRATHIYSHVRTYLITHAHLDHILSLLLLAGSVEGPRQSIRGSQRCLEDIETIFKAGRIWPSPANLYLYDPLPDDTEVYTPLHGSLSVRMFPISHGEDYSSSAFFVRHDSSDREFIFFGDVEPDTTAKQPRTHDVWHAAAPKIVAKTLDTIFIECSWPAGRPDDLLYGHLSPEHLVAELEVLATAVTACRNHPEQSAAQADSREASGPMNRKRDSSGASPERKRPKYSQNDATPKDLHNALEGLTVYITHCKEDMDGTYKGRRMHLVISEQVRDFVEEKGLGATILAAEQGALIHI